MTMNKYPSFGAMPRLHHDPHTAVLREQLALFYREQRYMDIILQCEGQEFPAHRLVLAAYSTMFSSLLSTTGHMQGNLRLQHLSVDNYNIRAVDLCALLSFMYTGRMDKHLVNSNSIKYTATVLGMLVFQQYADNFSHDMPFKPEGFDFSASHIPHRPDPNSALGLPIPPAELLPPLAHNTLLPQPQGSTNTIMPPQDFTSSNEHCKFLDYTSSVIENAYSSQLDYQMNKAKTSTNNQLYHESDDDFPDFASDVTNTYATEQDESAFKNCLSNKKESSQENTDSVKKLSHTHKQRANNDASVKQSQFILGTTSDEPVIGPMEHAAPGGSVGEHSCELCGQTFKALTSLNGHMAVHPQKERGVQKFICEICDKVFITKKGCQLHLDKHASRTSLTGGVFCCVKCNGVYDSRASFTIHMQTHCRGFRVNLAQNPSPKANHDDLSKKVISHGVKKKQGMILNNEKENCNKAAGDVSADNLESFTCEVCEAVYYTQDQLNGHMSKHKGLRSQRMKRFKCEICDKVLTSRKGGIQHVERYTLRSGKRCVKCKQKFETKNELKVHMRKHLTVISSQRTSGVIKLEEEEDIAPRKMHLRKSTRKYKKRTNHAWYSDDSHRKSTKTLTVKLKSNKSRNLTVKVKNHQCLLCGKIYTTRHGVCYHLDRHARESECVDGRYVCPCGQNFAGEIAFQVHMRTHRKTTTFTKETGKFAQYIQCYLCMKTFENIDILRKHLEKHIPHAILFKKKFRCKKCGQQSKDLMTLNEHMGEHGRAILCHICYLCKKQLPSKLKWKQHLQGHHLKFPLKCAHCPNVFSHHVSLAMHQRVHPQPEVLLAESYKCNQCEASFGTIFELYGHQVTHPSNVRNCIHTCNACSQPFESAEQLREHEQCHLLSVQCPQCHLRLRSHAHLERHSRRCNLKLRQENPCYQCATCLRVLGSAKGLNLHMKLHILPFVCKACGAKYESINALHWHQRLSHGVVFEVDKTSVTGQMRKTLICFKCGANFVNKRARFDAHMMQHSKYNPTQCRSCLKTFSSKCGLRFHKRRGCDGPGKRKRSNIRQPHTCMCSQCGRGFSKIIQLEIHEATHSDSVKFHCPKCSKGFYHKVPFSQHTKLCLNPKQFICAICGKILSTALTLENHMMLHTGEKPHKCTECGKGYCQPYQLQIHIRQEHTKERPFQCDICSATFTSKNVLRTHVRGKHSSVKPYSCEICGKQYSYNSHLKEHRFTHTGQSPYPCIVCGKGFMVNKKRDQHMKADHPEYQGLFPHI